MGSDAERHVKLDGFVNTLLRHAPDVVKREVPQKEQVDRMRNQNDDDAMLNACHPGFACNVFTCFPHKDTTEHSADGHGRNVVASHCLSSSSRAHDQPKLWQHCQ